MCKDPNGSILTDPTSVNEVFRKFYSDHNTNSGSFLDGLEQPKLSSREAEQQLELLLDLLIEGSRQD